MKMTPSRTKATWPVTGATDATGLGDVDGLGVDALGLDGPRDGVGGGDGLLAAVEGPLGWQAASSSASPNVWSGPRTFTRSSFGDTLTHRSTLGSLRDAKERQEAAPLDLQCQPQNEVTSPLASWQRVVP
jgi:hypothetical protein